MANSGDPTPDTKATCDGDPVSLAELATLGLRQRPRALVSTAMALLPGLRDYAATGQEVVLNGNTLENSLDQYVSMIKEKAVAGPHPDDPRFPNFFSSSELAAHWLFPGLVPTLSQRPPHFGDL